MDCPQARSCFSEFIVFLRRWRDSQQPRCQAELAAAARRPGISVAGKMLLPECRPLQTSAPTSVCRIAAISNCHRPFLPRRAGSPQDRSNRLHQPFATRLLRPSGALSAALQILEPRTMRTTFSSNCRRALEQVSSQFLSAGPESAQEPEFAASTLDRSRPYSFATGLKRLQVLDQVALFALR